MPASASPHGRARAAARTRPGTAAARRISGPVASARAGAGAAAVALPAPRRVGTGAFERLRGVVDSRLLGRLLHSRAWICLIGVALGGIVAMQVSLLKLNTGISRAVTSAATLERQNAALEAGNTRLAQVTRIRTVAAAAGMVTPAAGDIAFVTVRGPLDVPRALQRMRAPSAEAQAVMANGGRIPTAAPESVTTATTSATGALTPAAGAVAASTQAPAVTGGATAGQAPATATQGQSVGTVPAGGAQAATAGAATAPAATAPTATAAGTTPAPATTTGGATAPAP